MLRTNIVITRSEQQNSNSAYEHLKGFQLFYTSFKRNSVDLRIIYQIILVWSEAHFEWPYFKISRRDTDAV